MDENAVVEAVCVRLTNAGCLIVSRCSTKQRGIDVVARDESSGTDIFVEAKGGTSSRLSSPRFGKPYDQSQVFDRVSKGIFTCLELRAAHSDRIKSRVILAVPDAQWFRHYLDPVAAEMNLVGVEVCFLTGN